MKKNILLCTLGAVALLMPSGCSLDEENKSGISTEQEWSTAEGYEKKINDCYYDMIRIIYGQAEDTYLMMSETGTDIWQDANPQGSNGNWSKVIRYTDFGPSVGMFNEGYSGFYGTLSACNAAIEYADKVEGLTTEQVNQLVAEAHFIRAHALMNIVEYWGGKYMPLKVGEFPTSLPTNTVNEFYDTILSDLDFAKNNLPTTARVTGTVTRAAAYHLYAKACLTYSTYTDGLGNCEAISDTKAKELLNEAKTAADYLIDHASEFGVQLYDDVNDVFSAENNKSNKEALFVVTHSSIKAYNPRGNYYNRCWKHAKAYNNNNSGVYLEGLKPNYDWDNLKLMLAKGNCYMEPSYYMINLYGDKDQRYDAFFSDVYYVNNANNDTKDGYTWTESDAKIYGLNTSRVGNHSYDIALGDTAVYLPRKTYTEAERNACRYAVYNLSDNYKDQTTPLKFFPSLKKFDHPSMYSGSNPNKPYSYSDCIIYRLAETYLLSAEIEWRLGNAQKAVDRINVIRNRACAGHDHSMDITTSDLTQDFLLDEYARELIGEWSRWLTLKRFRAFESRIQKCNPQITTFKKDYYLRPIPAAEILLIENADEYQNPGY